MRTLLALAGAAGLLAIGISADDDGKNVEPRHQPVNVPRGDHGNSGLMPIIMQPGVVDQGVRPLWRQPGGGAALNFDRTKPIFVRVPAGYAEIAAGDYTLQPDQGYLTDPLGRKFSGPSGSWSVGNRNTFGFSVTPIPAGGYTLCFTRYLPPNTPELIGPPNPNNPALRLTMPQSFNDAHPINADGTWQVKETPAGWQKWFPNATGPFLVWQ